KRERGRPSLTLRAGRQSVEQTLHRFANYLFGGIIMFKTPILGGVMLLLLVVPGSGAPQGHPDKAKSDKVGEGNEPARPLQGRALDNLAAFAKLLGHVRYFHPSDEAAATKWDDFAREGVRAVEGAKTAEELAQILEKRFQSIAPTVQI